MRRSILVNIAEDLRSRAIAFENAANVREDRYNKDATPHRMRAEIYREVAELVLKQIKQDS